MTSALAAASRRPSDGGLKVALGGAVLITLALLGVVAYLLTPG